MRVLKSSEVHRIELVVPVTKDVQCVETPLIARSLLSEEPLSGLVAIGSEPDLESVVQSLLVRIERAIAGLEKRITFVRPHLINEEMDLVVTDYLEKNPDGPLHAVLAGWNRLCSDGSFELPAGTELHHVLLHCEEAWNELEASFRETAMRFFNSQQLVHGRYAKDGTTDYSIVYTLYSQSRWSSVPLEVRRGLRHFCQKEFFLTVDGKAKLIQG